MAFNFPSSPTVGQTYSQYVWDGEKWTWTVTATVPSTEVAGEVDFSYVGNALLVVLEEF